MFENQIESKVKIKLITSAKFLYCALMIKYTSKAINIMDWLMVIRCNYKKIIILITIQNCQTLKYYFNKKSFFAKL